MKKTVIIHDVPAGSLDELINDLKREGYNVSYYLEPDSQYTIIGTRNL